MLYPEDDLISISALSHYSFCPRRCALIHIEQMWTENIFTAEGRLMHERVHEVGDESRGNIRIARGVQLRSLRLGMIGVADVVEFHKTSMGVWQPFPVEYKRGKPKHDHSDSIQLCAQAVSLEEMLGISISKGALFYGKTRRRHEVEFDHGLREELEKTINNVRTMLNAGQTPAPVFAKKCDNCSLQSECLPKTIARHKSVKRYLAGVIRNNEEAP